MYYHLTNRNKCASLALYTIKLAIRNRIKLPIHATELHELPYIAFIAPNPM